LARSPGTRRQRVDHRRRREGRCSTLSPSSRSGSSDRATSGRRQPSVNICGRWRHLAMARCLPLTSRRPCQKAVVAVARSRQPHQKGLVIRPSEARSFTMPHFGHFLAPAALMSVNGSLRLPGPAGAWPRSRSPRSVATRARCSHAMRARTS
jgi:hypothetical protein